MGEGEEGNRTAALNQLSRRRRCHHLQSVVPAEAALMRDSSDQALRGLLDGVEDGCTGANWVLITTEIVRWYAVHLMHFAKQLESLSATGNSTVQKQWMFRAARPAP